MLNCEVDLFHIRKFSNFSNLAMSLKFIKLPFPNNPHVWHIDMNPWVEYVENLFPLLQKIEKDTAHSFYSDTDKNFYIVSHGILRLILAKYLKCQPSFITYSYSHHKKPYLANKLFSNFNFNLSHSGTKALIGISTNHKIGVDIEFVNNNDNLNKEARLIINDEEKVDYEKKNISLYNFWVCKEAILKALGVGLNIDPRKITLKNLNTTAPSVEISQDVGNNGIVLLKPIKIADSYACAIAQIRNIALKDNKFRVTLFEI